MIVIRATEADWRALLAVLPRCDACGHGHAEVTIDGRPMCCACAAGVVDGDAAPMPWATLATRIEDEIGPLHGARDA